MEKIQQPTCRTNEKKHNYSRVVFVVLAAFVMASVAPAAQAFEVAQEGGSVTGHVQSPQPEGFAPSATSTTGGQDDLPVACGTRVPHPLIDVRSDEGEFGLILGRDPVTGAPVYRPGSGVSSGNGTPEEPFVIEGLCLLYSPAIGETTGGLIGIEVGFTGIVISGTTSHLVLRDLVVAGYHAGIYMNDVSNLLIEGNSIVQNVEGIHLSRVADVTVVANHVGDNEGRAIQVRSHSHGVVVESNEITDNCGAPGVCYGVWVWGSTDVLVAGNTVTQNDGRGIYGTSADGMRVEGNTVVGNTGRGIEFKETTESTVIGNIVIQNGQDGIVIGGVSEQNEIRHNVVQDNVRRGIGLVRSQDNVVSNNSIQSNGWDGLYLQNSAGDEVTGNHVEGNDLGIKITFDTLAPKIEKNNVVNNVVGLDAISNEYAVDARQNWWGCPGGPDHAACDLVVGDVEYDPWLSEPVATDAGLVATGDLRAKEPGPVGSAAGGQDPNGLPGALDACGDHEIHPPIIINSDYGPLGFMMGFEPVTGEPIYRPGSGVTAGTGTPSDPFVIESKCIIGHNYQSTGQGWDGTDGIFLMGTNAHVVIRDNIVAGHLFGIRISQGASNVHITDNEIIDNRFQAVRLERADRNLVTENLMDRNGQGMNLRGSSDNVVRGNTIQNSTQGIVVASLFENGRFYGSYRNEISRNQIQDQSGHGAVGVFLLSHTADNTVSQNRLVRITASEEFVNSGRAIEVFASAGSIVERNHIEGNKIGIRLQVTYDAAVTDNMVVHNEDEGISSHRGSDLVLARNTVTFNGGSGASIFEPERLLFSGNVVEGNAGDGLSTSRPEAMTVSNNQFIGNDGHGAYLYGGRAIVVENNTSNGNALSGIWIGVTQGIEVKSNTLEGNQVSGLHVRRLEGFPVEENQIAANGVGVVAEEVFRPLQMRANNMIGNGVGVQALAVLDPVGGSGNWWGCAAGPEDPACDQVMGMVEYEPWLEEENPEAGSA